MHRQETCGECRWTYGLRGCYERAIESSFTDIYVGFRASEVVLARPYPHLYSYPADRASPLVPLFFTQLDHTLMVPFISLRVSVTILFDPFFSLTIYAALRSVVLYQ